MRAFCQRIGFGSIFLAALIVGAAEPPPSGIHGVIVDADTGKPVAARITIRAGDGKYYFSKSDAAEGSAIEFRKQRGASVEMHTTLSAQPFRAATPPGQYDLVVERGKEYQPVTNHVTVAQGMAETKITLHRWINLAARGWYSGDTHIHRAIEDLPNMVMAEDLNIAFPLSYWTQDARTSPVRTNMVKAPATKAEAITVDRTHLIYPLNTEYEIFRVNQKAHTLGAVLIIGQKTLLDRGVPPLKPVAEQAHAEGALLDLEKHSWPWSLAIVPLMKVDLFELSNNHVWATEFGLGKWTLDMAPPYMHLELNQDGYTEWGWIDYGFRTYYALLNCGFQLRPTAGTAAGVHPVPMAFGRVYVNQPDGFSCEHWLAGLKAGNSFVTTGPMLFVKVNGENPGHTFANAPATGDYRVSGSAESAVPLDRIEILANGEVIKTVSPENTPNGSGGWRSAIDYPVAMKGSGWIAVRVFEQRPNKRIRFAHSSPVFVAVPGRPLRPTREQIDYIAGQIEAEIQRDQAVLSEAELAEYRTALAVYRKIQEAVKGK